MTPSEWALVELDCALDGRAAVAHVIRRTAPVREDLETTQPLPVLPTPAPSPWWWRLLAGALGGLLLVAIGWGWAWSAQRIG